MKISALGHSITENRQFEKMPFYIFSLTYINIISKMPINSIHKDGLYRKMKGGIDVQETGSVICDMEYDFFAILFRLRV